MKINLLFSIVLSLILPTTTIYATSSTKMETKQNQASLKADASKVRLFIATLSFNKDGSELMFNECGEEMGCRIFRLNLINNTLRHYNFPDQDKYYTLGSFSPQGNYVILFRKLKTDTSIPMQEFENLAKEGWNKTEICLMNEDGSNFTVIKTKDGIKIKPIMNNDENKIAYLRSKNYGSYYDIYEIDLKAKTDNLFAGPYKFRNIHQMQYFKGDKEILVSAYGAGYNISSYLVSGVYKIKQGINTFPKPLVFDGIENSRQAFLTNNGSMFFYGEGIKKEMFKSGFSLFKLDQSKKITQWLAKFDNSLLRHRSSVLVATPDEAKVFIIYESYSGGGFSSIDINERGLAFFDTASSRWVKLNVPEAKFSEPITVTGSNIVKTNQFKKSFNPLKKLPNFSLTNPSTLKNNYHAR